MKTHHDVVCKDDLVLKRALTDAEHNQRIEAAKARWANHHRAETNPTIRQSSWGQGGGAPSARAAGLFRAGQTRIGRGGHGLWDTRSTELAAGTIRGKLTLHFPDAYRSETPDAPAGGKLLAGKLAAKQASKRGGKHAGPQAVIVANPGAIAEAIRHPEMRAIVHKAVGVVREHQAGAIETATKRRLIPAGAHPADVRQAYKHASLLALHKAGLVDWDFTMDDEAKRRLKPLTPFMRYAQRRVFDQLNVQLKGKWKPFRQQFGKPFSDQRTDAQGEVRHRMRPNQEFIKIEAAWDGLAKAVDPDGPVARIGELIEMRKQLTSNTASSGAVPRYQNLKTQYHANPDYEPPGSLQRFFGRMLGENNNALIPGPRKVKGNKLPKKFRPNARFNTAASAGSYAGGSAFPAAASGGSASFASAAPNPLYVKAAPEGELRKGFKIPAKIKPGKFTQGALAGAGVLWGAHKLKELWDNHPGAHAAIGAAAGIGATALLSRGHAKLRFARMAAKAGGNAVKAGARPRLRLSHAVIGGTAGAVALGKPSQSEADRENAVSADSVNVGFRPLRSVRTAFPIY